MSEVIPTQINPNNRLVKNALFSSISWFLPMVLTVLGTPIMVKGLGYEQYGLYSLILGFIGYSFTFGIGRVVTKYVSEYKSLNRTDEISEIISTTFWFTLFISLIGCFLIIGFAKVIVRDLLQVGSQFEITAIYGLYTASGSIGFMMVGQVFQAVLQGIHRFDKVSTLITINGFLLTIGNIVWVIWGGGLSGILIWNLFVAAINCILYFVTAKVYLPEFKIRPVFKKETVKLILNYSSGLLSYQIFSNIILIFERSWITRTLGAENLTYYVVPMTMALYLHAFISTVILVIFPVFSELQNQPQKLRQLYQRATKIVFLSIAFAVLTIIWSRNLFLGIWINQEFAEKSSLILMFHTLSFSIYGLLIVIWQLAEGFGKPRFNARISFIWLILSIPLMIFLSIDYGIIGVAVSRFAANFVTLPFIFIGEKHFLGEINWDFWKNFGLKISVVIILTSILEIIVFNHLNASWITLILGGILGFVGFVLAVIVTKLLTTDEIGLLKNLLKLNGNKFQ